MPMTTEARVADLLARMTLAEKAALMFHATTVIGPDGTLTDGVPELGIEGTEQLIGGLGLTHLNLLGTAADARTTAEWHNRLQRRALDTRLGIPITLASDPRHHFTDNPLASAMAGAFSQWPEPIGLAALRSPDLVARFADVVRQEYTAVGIRVAIHPQIDVATEPRWGRISGTFGEDAGLTAELGVAYVRGLQGETVGPTSVAAMVKHFPGGGPQRDGEDPHFPYGREQVYPGGRFRYHLAPFEAAIRAGAAQVMPYYGMPVGTEYEEVGFAFDRAVITGLLREELGFDGIVCTDWAIVTDSAMLGQTVPARAWGVERLGVLDRVQRVIDAGCDQFGGESVPELVVRLVEEGRVSEERIEASARRLLRQKFELGLFDNPFADPDRAESTVGRPTFVSAGAAAQRRAYTLLTNRDGRLPLATGLRVYAEHVDARLLARYATVVSSPAEADVALIRLKAPFEPRQGAFESLFHAGTLEYAPAERARQAALYRQVSTVVDLYLDRPAAVPEIAAAAAALLGSYGSSDEAFLDVVFGYAAPEGALPFDLPSSTAAVAASRPDVPFDTAGPLFRFGHGLRYPAGAVRPRPAGHAPAAEPVAAPRGSGPADVDGTWTLTVQTPGGDRPATLRLTGAGKTLSGDLNGTPITHGRIDDDRISFKAALTEPFKLKVNCTATVSGDQLTGTAKAALIPISVGFTGSRLA
ncbi:glycoside hydrolase family 3 protein [Dactylosporangium sp. CA-092794]|uniref:glycoside hydrolase family 3 protein n=1 Tax=Dactylosporangium sp. CA-092794 TaxID=3239929 RepID=UPI003D9281B9